MTFPITACPQNHASLLCWALASSNSAASAVTVGGTRYQAEESGFLLSRGPFFESQSAEKIREQWFCSSGFGVSPGSVLAEAATVATATSISLNCNDGRFRVLCGKLRPLQAKTLAMQEGT